MSDVGGVLGLTYSPFPFRSHYTTHLIPCYCLSQWLIKEYINVLILFISFADKISKHLNLSNGVVDDTHNIKHVIICEEFEIMNKSIREIMGSIFNLILNTGYRKSMI